MTIRLSTGLRNHLMASGSLKNALYNGKLQIYTGSQPSSADAAPTGTLLCTITNASLAHTAEVLATGTVTLTGGASGSVDTVTVNSLDILGGSVAFNTSLTQTAADVAAQINRNQSNPDYEASSSGAVVTIKAKRGTGTSPNAWVVSATLTTITASYANMSGGVAAANGLLFDHSADGEVTKKASQTWTGVAGASGTAGWGRFVGAVADGGDLDSDATDVRLDGSISASGGDIGMSNTTVVSGATQTVSSFAVNIPAS